MNFISTKDMNNENAPEGKVLVKYLEPFFGGWNEEYAIGYYDNPKHYENNEGDGWKHWVTENKINVISYCLLGEIEDDSILKGKTQKETYEEFGTYTPKMGCVGI